MNRSALSLFCASLTFLVAGLAWGGPVNINTADAATLAAELDGVGPALAEEIVRDREQNGAFDSPDALTRVKGIGPRIVEMNRANILTRDPEKT
ncbi:MAG TPA: helix-hairpin-helix domain-containing protein [Gammaproteobacteria bacterium]